MSYKEKIRCSSLRRCRVCDQDAGECLVTEREPEVFYVACMCCGFSTRTYATPDSAVREWNGGKR